MEMQIEVTMTHHLLRVNIGMAIIETKTVKDGQCRENMERLYAGGSSVTRHSQYGNSVEMAQEY